MNIHRPLLAMSCPLPQRSLPHNPKQLPGRTGIRYHKKGSTLLHQKRFLIFIVFCTLRCYDKKIKRKEYLTDLSDKKRMQLFRVKNSSDMTKKAAAILAAQIILKPSSCTWAGYRFHSDRDFTAFLWKNTKQANWTFPVPLPSIWTNTKDFLRSIPKATDIS